MPVESQRPHPTNLREAKVQGRTRPRRKRRTPVRGRPQTGARETQKPNPRSSINRPVGRSLVVAPFSHVARDVFWGETTQRSHRFTRAGQSRSENTATDRWANGRWVRAGGDARLARQRDQTCEGKSETPRAPSGEGVGSDTVTRVTYGRTRCRLRSPDGKPSKLRDAERGPTRPRDLSRG